MNLWLGTGPVPDSFVGGSIQDRPQDTSTWESHAIALGGHGVSVVASGYTTANADGTGVFTQADVRRTSDGLGVCDPGRGSVDRCNARQGGIDNAGRADNLIVFDLGASNLMPLGFTIGWAGSRDCSASGRASGRCPDIEAWIGSDWPSDALDYSFLSADNGWTKILSANPTSADNDIQPSTARHPNYTSFDAGIGRYLVIAPERDGSDNDFFRLQTISFTEAANPTPVPVPGSLGLLALGSALGLLVVRRLPRG